MTSITPNSLIEEDCVFLHLQPYKKTFLKDKGLLILLLQPYKKTFLKDKGHHNIEPKFYGTY